MRSIVITGSTRGIGRGMADAFLARGCAVAISGRTADAVDQAVEDLAARHERARILGRPCDVTRSEQVEALWEVAKERFGTVDIWINNAALTQPSLPFWTHPSSRLAAVVETNLLGTMYGAAVAIQGMLAQGHGAVYTLEGLGSDGRKAGRMTLYGTTKAGIRYFTESLAREVVGTPVLVGALSPGMVVTDLLVGERAREGEDWERAKHIYNILADRVETVAPWLADRVLANERNGVRIAWLTPWKIAGRFLSAPVRRRDLFAEDV
ncbi:MAG: SDR family oxidoreductase [Anaerolineae bacterium]|nr:SDR family oxidoreductase [Anaerolineae bacterium]